MNDQEKHEHDQKTNQYGFSLNAMSENGVLFSALAMLILGGKTSKYELAPQEAAVAYECFHRADPSFSW